MSHLHQAISVEGAFEALRALEASAESFYSAEDMTALMARCGIESPKAAIGDFVASNLLCRSGDRFGLTTWGIRTLLLLEAINGGDLKDIYRRLARFDSTLRAYELVRVGMTDLFLRNINDRPGFRRLYLCSPWISFDRKQADLLLHAILHVERTRGSRPELLVITRPGDDDESTVPASLLPFQKIGATIFLNKRLHTKLYIREPDSSGGYSMAIIGSQNLTRSRYLELGIRINSDGQMIDQLIAYFWELTYHSQET